MLGTTTQSTAAVVLRKLCKLNLLLCPVGSSTLLKALDAATSLLLLCSLSVAQAFICVPQL